MSACVSVSTWSSCASCGKFRSSDSRSVTHSFPGSDGCGRYTLPLSTSGVTARARASFPSFGLTALIPLTLSLSVSITAVPFALSSTSRSCTRSPHGFALDSGPVHSFIRSTVSVKLHRPRCCASRYRFPPDRAHRCATT